MPTYDYKCLTCNHRFETFQKMTDAPLMNCPECGGEVKRLIGAGFRPIFKGSGFYQTDYKNTTPKKETTTTEKTVDNSSATIIDKKPSTKSDDT